MPKTEAEYDIEIAKIKGELVAKQKELDSAISAEAHAKEDLVSFKTKVAGFEKTERDRIEAEVHAIQKDFDCKGKSNEYLQAFMEGVALGHSVPVQTPIPHSTAAPKPKGNAFDCFNV